MSLETRDRFGAPSAVAPGKRLFLAALFVSVVASAAGTEITVRDEAPPPSPTCRFVGGRWFDGERFVSASYASVNGILTDRAPDGTECRVELGDRYVIAPLGEAHIHSLNEVSAIREQIAHFMTKGVFYAMVQDSIFEIGPEIRSQVNRPDTVDVVYAQGPLVGPQYGTLQDIYQRLLDAGAFGTRKSLKELDTREIFLVEDASDLAAKWDRLVTKNRDIVKVLLAFSDQYNERRSRAGASDKPRPGIDPALLPEIVQRAHAAGLRVSTHVETAGDIEAAVQAGADIIAHLPGWRIGVAAGYAEGDLAPFRISPSVARQAARQGTVVVTTTTPKAWLSNTEESLPRWAELHASNLELLLRHGVTVALGSDDRGGLVPREVKNLAELGVIDAPALLRLATETTPRFIFPKRRIGRLAEGYEASFIALDGNPLEDLANLDKISLWVKQGHSVGGK